MKKKYVETYTRKIKYPRLRVVSNFGDDDCGAGEIHTRARAKFRGNATRRERRIAIAKIRDYSQSKNTLIRNLYNLYVIYIIKQFDRQFNQTSWYLHIPNETGKSLLYLTQVLIINIYRTKVLSQTRTFTRQSAGHFVRLVVQKKIAKQDRNGT